MGYFDYLDQANVQEKKDEEFFDTYAKWSFRIGLVGLGIMIIGFILLCVFGFGKIVWLSLVPLLSFGAVAVSLFFAIKTLIIAKKKGKTAPLAWMCLAWGIFFVLCDIIFIVVNTLIYFG